MRWSDKTSVSNETQISGTKKRDGHAKQMQKERVVKDNTERVMVTQSAHLHKLC